MKYSDTNALFGWALHHSKLLTVTLLEKHSCALLIINDTPELSFLIRSQQPFTPEVRTLILEAFFQEHQETASAPTEVLPVLAPANGEPPEEPKRA